MTVWKWLTHPDLGVHRVPDNAGVVESFEGRSWQATDIDGELASDSEEFADALAARQATQDAEELKGKALDQALEEAGLSKSGTVADKQARLAEAKASQGTEAETSAVNEKEDVNG